MAEKFILMCADTVVAERESGMTGEWIVNRPELLPYGLDTRALKPTNIMLGTEPSSWPKFIAWLAGRTLSIDRAYAKKVLNALKLTQSQDPFSKAEIAIAFRGVSLCDSYWFRFFDEDSTEWKDVNLRENSLSKAIALIALSGTSMSLAVKNIQHTAEVTTIGSYAKGWFRDDTGQLWLYKTKGPESDEVEREVCASNVIDCFNVYGNLKYEFATMEGVKASRCKLMSNAEKSIVHAADVDNWCIRNNTDVITWAKKHYRREYAQMVSIDYLIANSDRHSWNWGFYQDVKTGEIIGPHELYDHNNAFDPQLLNDESWDSILESNKTMKEAALFWVKRSDLKLIKKPTLKMFPSRLAYDVFIKRCKQLGLLGL